MRRIVLIYNLISYMISMLLKVENIDFQNYHCKTASWYNQIDSDLKNEIPCLFEDDRVVLIVDFVMRYDLEKVLDDIKAIFDSFLKAKKYENSIRLLYWIDQLVKLAKSTYETEEIFISLNDNYKETGNYILPFVSCYWKRGSRGTQHRYTLNHCLENTYYILDNKLNDLEVMHIVMKAETFMSVQEKHSIKIGYSPVTNLKVVENIKYQEVDDMYFFTVEDIKNKDVIREKILKTLEIAKEKKVDILVFPEMLGYDELNQEIKEILESNFDGLSYPTIIVLPSVWKDNKNVADIFLNDGDVILHQEKQNPVIFDHACEYILPDKKIYVIHVPLLGRICVAICKDFLEMDYLNILLNDIQASMIIVPSFSTGSYDFFNQIGQCKSYDTDVVWINSCSALHLDPQKRKNFQYIGAVLKSGKNSGDMEMICTDDCNEICRNDVCFHMVNINMQEDGVCL